MTPIINNTARPTFVVLDNFLADPMAWREFALGQNFVENPQFHKGKRTEQRWLPEGFKESFEIALGLRIPNWEEFGTNGVFQVCVAGEQIVYHSDFQTYAGLLYLTPDAPPQSGTAAYKSVRYGWNKAPTAEEAESVGMSVGDATKSMYGGKLLDPTAWVEIDRVGNVFNRLVLFDAKIVHSARDYFGTGLQDGRLFQLFFFNVA